MAEGYGKRPMWQWILIYLVIGGIAYFAIYKFLIAPKGGYSGSSYGTGSSVQQNNSSGSGTSVPGY